MIKKLILLVVGIMMAALFAGCGNDTPNAQKEQAGKKIQVVTSFNAMAEFTKAIGGDKVDVSTIIPDGVEPHDFELKPENMKQLATAQVFVYNGFGMEPWAKQAIEAAKNDKLVSVVATEGVEAIKNTDKSDVDCLLSMELIDFTYAEYLRDSGILGRNRVALGMGHFNLEEPGMEYMLEYLDEAIGEHIPAWFKQSGDNYEYMTKDCCHDH